jgi:Transposase DDE domain group 1
VQVSNNHKFPEAVSDPVKYGVRLKHLLTYSHSLELSVRHVSKNEHQRKLMTCYSIDFRKKIIESHEQGNTSIRAVAKRFLVSLNWASKSVVSVCHSFDANQSRLLLAQAAYVLLLKIRQAASVTILAKAHVQRLGDTLLKCAAIIKVSVRRVLAQFPTFFPFGHKFSLISNQLTDPSISLFA